MRFRHAFFLAALPALAQAQQSAAKVPIRQVSKPVTAAQTFRSIASVRELGSRVLVDADEDRALLLYDAGLGARTVLADSTNSYASGGRVLPYLGDSALFLDFSSRATVLIGPDGKLGRVIALARPQDFALVLSSPVVGIDARGRLIYQGRGPLVIIPGCRMVDGRPNRRDVTPADSVVIIRADFDTRTVDTIGRVRASLTSTFPVATVDDQCRTVSAKVKVNPSIPPMDGWAVTSAGAVALVRNHDYHIDWIDGTGTHATDKLPFDWRRITDAEKQARLDSAKHIIDSLTAIGGYRLRQCGNITRFSDEPMDTVSDPRAALAGLGAGGGARTIRAAGGGRGGDGGDTPPPPTQPACQSVVVNADYAKLDEMADYISPIREGAVTADRDGNVWILPTTSSGAKNGLLYDVVNSAGVLVERVQLPSGRSIAGFGKGGVVFLANHLGENKLQLERVTIVR
ncbi:MAG TPA: hypothetical protein VE967_08585 [Gemmatimonadaceae bacterium]|nr:hypothetical protein [Gemmatimonadaceae bacterium]